MSIASRIEAMEGHIADDYEVLELAGADLTDVDKNIINLKQTWQERLLYFINNGTDEVWNNWEKVTGSGTSATLNGTVEAPMKVELKPSELSQEQEEPSAGKEVIDTSITVNDLNPSKISKITLKGNTYQETTTGKNKLNVPSTYSVTGGVNCKTILEGIGAGTYRISCKSVTKGGSNNPTLVINNTAVASLTSNYEVSITIPETINDAYLYSNGYNYTASQGVTSIIENLMISESGGDYEPYTNGPSPNPDYPQDIEVVAGENTVTVSNGDNTQSQTYTMSLGTLELCKIGNYQDLFFKNVADSEYYDSTLNENSWYLKKMTGKFTLGNVSWYSYDEREIVATALSNGVFPPPLENSSGYVNCLPLISSSAISNSSEDAEKTGFYIGGGGWTHVQIPISLLPTRDAAGVKSWLSTNNAVLYYALATPQNIEIQNQTLINQLEALYNATTYSTTKINTSTSNLLPYIDLRYNITTGSSPSPTNPSDIHTVSGENTVVVGNKNLFVGYENMQSGFLPSSGDYPTTNTSYPNAKYQLIELKTGESITTSGSSSTWGRIRYINKATNKILGSVIPQNATANDYYISTGNYSSGFVNGTITAKQDIILGVMVLKSTTDYKNFQIEYNSTATSYVEHQEQSLPLNLGDLEYCKIGNYEDSFIKTSGKNLFDESNMIKGYYNTNDLSITLDNSYRTMVVDNLPAGTYTFSTTLTNCRILRWATGNTNTGIGQNLNNLTITTTQTAKLMICFRKEPTSIITETFYTMLNKGSTATEYEPYGTGEWYLKKNVGKVVFDGSENWSLQTNVDKLNYYIKIENSLGGSNYLIYSNIGVYRSYLWSENYTTYISSSNNLNYHCDSIPTLNDFKTYLNTTNMIVYYRTATPTFTLLSDTLQTQLENIYKAMSYDGQTNVSQENADLPFVLSLSALKDLSE